MNRSERTALGTSVLVPVVFAAVWLEAPLWCGLLLLFICPLAVLWLVWTVLHDNRGTDVELPPGQEWDYSDRPDLTRR